MAYREARDGQILEEGIAEAGAMASTTAAGTAYATHGLPMVPFYIFYSMFGFQRVGDLIWAFGDSKGRGFLLGATAGRTTLMGEGLQHCDGHSRVLFSVMLNLRAYDPAFAYEVAVLVRDGLKRMLGRQEDGFYYLTLYNETYPQPPMPEGVEEGIIKGMYLFRGAPERLAPQLQLSGSGPILRDSPSGPGDLGGEVRHWGGGVVCHQLPAAPTRCLTLRALKPFPPGGATQGALPLSGLGGTSGPDSGG